LEQEQSRQGPPARAGRAGKAVLSEAEQAEVPVLTRARLAVDARGGLLLVACCLLLVASWLWLVAFAFAFWLVAD